MRNIIPLKAGKLAYQKYNPDGTLNPALYTTGLTVQSIEPLNLSITTQDIPDGNSLWPLAVVETEASAQVIVNFSDYNPKVHADMVGGTVTESGTDTMFKVDEELKVPDSTPFTVTLSETPLDSPAIVICNLENSPFVKVASAPETGQYSVSGNAVTFNSADAGKEMFATYAWQGSSTTKVSIPKDVSIPTVRIIIVDEAEPSNRTGNKFDTTFILDKARATGNINAPVNQKTPGTWSLTLQAMKPRAGENLATLTFEQRS